MFTKHFLHGDATLLQEIFGEVVDGCVHVDESHFLLVEEVLVLFHWGILAHDFFSPLFLKLLELGIGVIEIKDKGILLGLLGAGNLSHSDG